MKYIDVSRLTQEEREELLLLILEGLKDNRPYEVLRRFKVKSFWFFDSDNDIMYGDYASEGDTPLLDLYNLPTKE